MYPSNVDSNDKVKLKMRSYLVGKYQGMNDTNSCRKNNVCLGHFYFPSLKPNDHQRGKTFTKSLTVSM